MRAPEQNALLPQFIDYKFNTVAIKLAPFWIIIGENRLDIAVYIPMS